MTNFLVTGIGGDLGQNVAYILKNYDENANIIGCDIHSDHGGKEKVDKFFVIKDAKNHKEYLKELNETIKIYNINYLIPGSQPEIELINNQEESIFPCHIISPGKKVIDNCLDKYKTNNFLASIGVEVPWTVLAENKMPIEYPCILKKRKGSGQKDFFTVSDVEEANFLSKKYKDSMFQQLLLPDDQEVTCAIFRSKKGKISILQLKIKLQAGSTSWAKVIFNSEIQNVCELVATKLNLEGSMNIQLRLTNQGPRIFEINPRFSSTLYMRSLIGFDDLIWSIKDKAGLEFSFPKIKSGTELARIQSGIKLKSVK